MAKRTGFSLCFPMITALALLLVSGCATHRVTANLQHTTATEAETPLMEAAKTGDLEWAQELTRAGQSLNTLTEQGSPLMAAVAAGQDRIALYLLSEGAAPDLTTVAGITPLMVASAEGSRRLVKLLLSAGARVNAVDAQGYTPVMRAAGNGHLSVLKVLLAAGANVNVTQGNESLLMSVVASGDLLTVETLLAAGAEVNYRNEQGASALDIARINNNRDLEMLLIQAGAEF